MNILLFARLFVYVFHHMKYHAMYVQISLTTEECCDCVY